MGFLLDVVDGHANGVPHGGAAARIDVRKRLLHFGDVVGEVLTVGQVEVSVVVEIDDENLVVPVGGLDQSQRRRRHLGPLVAHAAAVIDNQPQRNRHVLPLEHLDSLRHAVFGNRKSRLGKVRHQMAGLVHHRRMTHHQARVGAEHHARVLRAGRNRGFLLAERG